MKYKFVFVLFLHLIETITGAILRKMSEAGKARTKFILHPVAFYQPGPFA
jgi:hypothetical protein